MKNQVGGFSFSSKSNFRSNAMSFGAGAVGGIAAYSLMSHMSSGYHHGPGYYRQGYGSKRY